MRASTVVMISASGFAANPETRASNAFQAGHSTGDAALPAVEEQASLMRALEGAGVNVLLLDAETDSPDAVFPNNWFSTHADGTLVIYPMEAVSRRREVIEDIALRLDAAGFMVGRCLDLRGDAGEGEFLEGTGSLVLDHRARAAYLGVSSRSSLVLAAKWCEMLGFVLHPFTAVDPEGRPVYHTNVVMTVGDGIAVACLEAIRDEDERRGVRRRMLDSGLALLELRWDQVCRFAGNMLFLQGNCGPVIAMSASAWTCLDETQRRLLAAHGEPVVADIATIERYGGGSVRCMLAEVFLPRKTLPQANK